MFEQIALAGRVTHHIGDIRDAARLREIVAATRPDFVFHLAAQPLVRESYKQPVETYNTNLIGTIHLLEALRALDKPCAAVFVTTDKCYENREWVYGYREIDPLGGADPYSSSKAACEIAIAAWRKSFFSDHVVSIASARAGNVIGGGDWADDRIVPDCVRALAEGAAIPVRNKAATRPWQHVLEPLSGYLHLAASIHASSEAADASALRNLCGAFNFGPLTSSNRSVEELVTKILEQWPGQWEDRHNPAASPEARLLSLATEKAFALLKWEPVWNFDQCVHKTVSWYRSAADANDLLQATRSDIADYVGAAKTARVAWAQ